MLTVKYITPSGEENICECERVVYDRTENDGRPRVLVFDGVPSSSKDNNAGVYVAQSDNHPDSLSGNGTVYVMNRHGATVATYRL